jgi:hypothetical protein
MPGLMTRELMLEALRRLGGELHARGARAEIVIVGGAAMALGHDARASTKDVDVLEIVGDPAEVLAAAADVAPALGLPADWLNEEVRKVYQDVARPSSAALPPVFVGPGLSVRCVAPEQLLAMKLCAARDELDLEDARFLLRKLSGLGKDTVWAMVEPHAIRRKLRDAFDTFEDLWEQLQ